MAAKQVFLMEYQEQYVNQFQSACKGGQFEIVGTAENGEATLQALSAMKDLPEIVVVTLTVEHGMDGPAVIKELNKRNLGVKILVSYTIDSKMRLVEALKAGAADRIRKPFEKQDVIKRLTKVHLLKGTGSGGFFRNSIRLSKPLPITFGKPGLFAKKFDGRTVDISTEGCRIQANEKIEKSAMIKIVLDLPQHGTMKVKGKVMNVSHDKVHSTYEAGVEFKDLTDKVKEQLNQYIMDEAEKV